MSEENQPNYTISQENWSLHRKGYDDQQRHQEKVQEAIKNNLPDLVTEESIVMSNGKDVVKIPIRSLDEYKIRYNYDKNKHVGQGNGDSKVGDVVARDGSGNFSANVITANLTGSSTNLYHIPYNCSLTSMYIINY